MEEAETIIGIVANFNHLTASHIARRSLILSAVVCRGSIENGAGDPDAEDLQQRILAWLTHLDLWNEVEPSEEALIRAPLGSLDTNEVFQATWYVEGIAILGWALKRFDLPKHDVQVDNYEVTDALDFLDNTVKTSVANTELRSITELEACRELLYAIHTRLRNYARNRTPKDFTQWVAASCITTLCLSYNDLIAEDDIAIDGKPISQVEEDRLQEVMSIILERHRAIIWLVGEQASYSEITVDTLLMVQ